MRDCLIYIGMMLSFGGFAQTPFAGGNGDGYSSTGLEFDPVAVSSSIVSELSIYPSVVQAGRNFYILTDEIVQEVEMLSFNGREVGKLVSLRENTWGVPHVSTGLYLLRVRMNNGSYYHSRLIISDH